MVENFDLSNLKIDPSLFSKGSSSESEAPALSSYTAQYSQETVAAMQALAPNFGLTAEIVGQPGDTVSDYDWTMRHPPVSWSVIEGNQAARVTGPSTQDKTLFHKAVKEALEQKNS